MDVFEAFGKRHSYRDAFESTPVSRDDLRRILDAGRLAPSGMNRQTTRFIAVDDPALLESVRFLHTSQAIRTAPAIIVCLVDKEALDSNVGMSFQIEDSAMAVENMLLAITALGYASVMIDGALRRDDCAKRLGEILGAPESKIVRTLLPIGIPVQSCGQPEKIPLEERAFFNQYGNPA